MSPFEAFMLWLGLCWLVVAIGGKPLQPDQLTDELADVDLSDIHRQREIREAAWLDRPVVNISLMRRFR